MISLLRQKIDLLKVTVALVLKKHTHTQKDPLSLTARPSLFSTDKVTLANFEEMLF